MSQFKVRNTVIQSAVTALAGKDVAWANKLFKPTGGLWFAVHYMPSKPTQATLGLGGEDELRSILQIDVNVPSNSGEKTQLEELSFLEDTYPSGHVLTYEGQSATVLSCARSNGRLVNADWRVSLSIYLRSRYPRPTPVVTGGGLPLFP